MSKKYKSAANRQQGSMLILVLVFGGIFIILFSGLSSFIILQHKQTSQKIALEQSLTIAEAGLDYYRWCLNNQITDECFETKEYLNSSGVPIGKFTLEITPKTNCGATLETTVISSGWTYNFPQIIRKISALYARTSVAKYAYLLNSNVWAGADREIKGPYHSNSGIRMDGENTAMVTSAQETWTCTSTFGCNPSREEDGVFTTTENSNPDLFDFPVTPFDFAGITIDLAQIKNLSKIEAGALYLPPSVDLDSNGQGYHLVFKNNSTFEIWIITDLNNTWGYNQEENWHDDYFIINNEYLYNTYNIDSACSLVFIEDNLWIEGELNGKITVASADLTNPNQETSITLPGNIEYNLNPLNGLALISQKNVLIAPNSPDNMELCGIFIAQNGRFGRNHYLDNIKSKLEIAGSIVSNIRVGTKWTAGGQIISGYLNRENYIDSNLIYNAPAFVPSASSEYHIINWQEVE